MSIWNFKQIRKQSELSENSQITLNEGFTRSEVIDLGNSSKLFIKREDLNPTGSWKDRGTAYKLSKLINNDVKEAVISSSGNAAISYLKYATENDFKMHVVVSPEINDEKKEIIESSLNNIHEIHYATTARAESAKIAAKLGIPNLRASTDDEILVGYWSLGLELYKDIISKNRDKNIIIICSVSSGTTAVGIARGLQLEIEKTENMPKFIFTQTSECHPLVDSEVQFEESLAEAIVDKALLRKPMLQKILTETNGYALSISNEQLVEAKSYTKSKSIDLSYTSLLPIAGFREIYNNDENTIFITIASGR